MHKKYFLPLLILLVGLPVSLLAQKDPIPVPRKSPPAMVSQTIGFTDMSISYHRPAAKGRVIWGKLVPYNQMWRSGANEITSISFEHEVQIEGETLPAGTYGLHILPKENEAWEVAFSSNSTDWGSYNYRQEEDVLRVSVSPTTGNPYQEWLGYSFNNLSKDGADIQLHWGELVLSMKVSIDVNKHILAQFRQDLRTHAFFGWQGHYQAAKYCFDEGINQEEAMQWLHTSIAREPQYPALLLLSQVLEKEGKTEESKAAFDNAISLASSKEIYYYTRGMIRRGEADKAIALMKKVVERQPDGWWAYMGLGSAYQKKGDTDMARKHYEKALAKVSPEFKGRVEAAMKSL